MPKRDDIETILIIGAGPIVIGQACEFDYSGTQGCKALKELGYRVVLVNSNPATIMTDAQMADRTYIEPLTPEVLEAICAQERPQALLPTLGGQTALNLAVELAHRSVLQRYGIELIGAKLSAIEKAENRALFKEAMQRIGLVVPRSHYVRSLDQARRIRDDLGLPCVVRPSFTLGGGGGNVATTPDSFDQTVAWGLAQSPTSEVLIEESVLGWKEYELEVMRDLHDNVVIICSIENFDPMGIHTGDSITVAPAMTLTDKEYQRMRNAACAIIREIGVDTGGSNIQFAVHPKDGRMVVVEMNPRVSRSSALASKATGFPIAKIAAKLAVGLRLDEIPNDITRETPASFEPTIDYVVVKIPRFDFDKFPDSDTALTTQMKSVGEVMAIGRTFKQALEKAIRSLEIDRFSLTGYPEGDLRVPSADRLWRIATALAKGRTIAEVFQETQVDPWFLHKLKELVDEERSVSMQPDSLRSAKRAGLSDVAIAQACHTTEEEVRERRLELGVRPVFLRVDTCAAEFEAHTPYLYSTYEAAQQDEAKPTSKKKIVILGGGPNRIGQGIEFDYCCVHAVMALREEGYETIMVNCNPETVSTDYDTADRLYFEPLTREDVLSIIDVEKPFGVIVQFGGQTPLKLAVALERAGVRILGTSADAIDRAEDRARFGELLRKLKLLAPRWGIARSPSEAASVAAEIGYPVMVRPSYVLGGRAMRCVYSDEQLHRYMELACAAVPNQSILIDQFLSDATEVDVDALCDGHDVQTGGIMEHIEEAGIHSGDSACSLPPYSLSQKLIKEITEQTHALAMELGVIGLLNIQFAIQKDHLYVLEVNPRASRTVPFVSKATGVPLAKLAAKIMAGRRLRELWTSRPSAPYMCVKEAVLPFIKFPGADPILGPEMRSTGEVMGIHRDFAQAFAKAQLAAGNALPESGCVFVSVRDSDKMLAAELAQKLHGLGFSLLATRGTAAYLAARDVPCQVVNKVAEGSPHIVDRMQQGKVQLVVNTTLGETSVRDSLSLRRAAVENGICYVTTMAAARAAVLAIEARAQVLGQSVDLCCLQDL